MRLDLLRVVNAVVTARVAAWWEDADGGRPSGGRMLTGTGWEDDSVGHSGRRSMRMGGGLIREAEGVSAAVVAREAALRCNQRQER